MSRSLGAASTELTRLRVGSKEPRYRVWRVDPFILPIVSIVVPFFWLTSYG